MRRTQNNFRTATGEAAYFRNLGVGSLTINGATGLSSPISLGDLPTGATAGQIIQYSGSAWQFASLSAISDFTLSTENEGDTLNEYTRLAFSGQAGSWAIDVETVSLNGIEGGGVALGADSVQPAQNLTTGRRGTSIGCGAQSGILATAVGFAAQATADSTVAIGSFSNATTASAVALGYNATATAGVAVGSDATASATDATAIGSGASAVIEATAVGAGATAYTNQSVAVGKDAEAGTLAGGVNGEEYCTAVGHYARATGQNSVAMGNSTLADAEFGVAIGAGSKSSANGAISIGSLTLAEGAQSVAIGGATAGTTATAANATGAQAVAIGANSYASGAQGIAIGRDANVDGVAQGIAIGDGALVTSADRALDIVVNSSTQFEDMLMARINGGDFFLPDFSGMFANASGQAGVSLTSLAPTVAPIDAASIAYSDTGTAGEVTSPSNLLDNSYLELNIGQLYVAMGYLRIATKSTTTAVSYNNIRGNSQAAAPNLLNGDLRLTFATPPPSSGNAIVSASFQFTLGGTISTNIPATMVFNGSTSNILFYGEAPDIALPGQIRLTYLIIARRT